MNCYWRDLLTKSNSGLTYINAFKSGKQAAIYNALLGIGWGAGAILGPLVGGAFSVSSASWRWVCQPSNALLLLHGRQHRLVTRS